MVDHDARAGEGVIACRGFCGGRLQEKKRERGPRAVSWGTARRFDRPTGLETAGGGVRRPVANTRSSSRHAGALGGIDQNRWSSAFGRPAITKSVNIRRWISRATAPVALEDGCQPRGCGPIKQCPGMRIVGKKSACLPFPQSGLRSGPRRRFRCRFVGRREGQMLHGGILLEVLEAELRRADLFQHRPGNRDEQFLRQNG
jgi:hypothetical protein